MMYFKFNEFDSPDLPGSGEKSMNRDFLQKLDKARGIANVPFQINSGYRTRAHNKYVGGKPTSSHMKGRAADIHCPDSATRWIIINSLLEAGFNRIGVGNTFVHVDDDPSKAPDLIWVY
jgi:uncharacterized protein YcbK (DUF882 family)